MLPSSSSSPSYAAESYMAERFAKLTMASEAPSATAAQATSVQPKRPLVQACVTYCHFPDAVAELVEQYVTVHKTTLFFNTLNFVYYQLPNGKPDPQQPCTAATKITDRRRFVPQKGADCAHTCAYYALNMIRFRIGKNPTSDLQKARDLEESASRYRKVHTGLNSLIKSDPQKYKRSNLPLIDIEILKDCYGMPIDMAFKKIGAALPQGLTWESFEELIRANSVPALGSSLNRVMAGTLAQYYELTKSQWHGATDTMDAHHITQLIEELQRTGPLVVLGNFGRSCYSIPPQPLLELPIEGCQLLGWGPKAKHKKLPDATPPQAITIVGARKEGEQEYVYYVDPFDASDSACEALRKVYQISYAFLVKNAVEFEPGLFAYAAKVSPNVKELPSSNSSKEEPIASAARSSSSQSSDQEVSSSSSAPKAGRARVKAKRKEKRVAARAVASSNQTVSSSASLSEK